MFLPWNITYTLEKKRATDCFWIIFRSGISCSRKHIMWSLITSILTNRSWYSTHTTHHHILWQPISHPYSPQPGVPWTDKSHQKGLPLFRDKILVKIMHPVPIHSSKQVAYIFIKTLHHGPLSSLSTKLEMNNIHSSLREY